MRESRDLLAAEWGFAGCGMRMRESRDFLAAEWGFTGCGMLSLCLSGCFRSPHLRERE